MSREFASSKVIYTEEEPQRTPVRTFSPSIAAAIGTAERGPIGKPVKCMSFPDYQRVFGGYPSNSDLPLAVRGFFQNGGSQIYVTRTAHYADPTDSESTAKTAKAVGEGDGEFVAKSPGTYVHALTVEKRMHATGRMCDVIVRAGEKSYEVFPRVSLDRTDDLYLTRRINHPLLGSQFIAALEPTGEQKSYVARFAGGSEGLDGLVDEDFVGAEISGTGLHSLSRTQDAAILFVPGRASPIIHSAMLEYCEVFRAGSLFGILDSKPRMSAQDAADYVDEANIHGKSSFGALYWPRILVSNPSRQAFGNDDLIAAPPSGHIAGAYARSDASKQGGIYQVAAGPELGQLMGAFGFDNDECLEENKRDIVYPKRVNPLTSGPGWPCHIDGTRTLKNDRNFPSILERRSAMFLAKSLQYRLQYFRHLPPTQARRDEIDASFRVFLEGQMALGAFKSNNPDKAFFIDISDTLNTPAVLADEKFRVRVGFALNRPAEFVELLISNTAIQEAA